MYTSHITLIPLLTVLVASVGCGGDYSGGSFDSRSDDAGDTDDGNDSGTGLTEGSDTGDTSEDDACGLDCGAGTCVVIDGEEFCECPEDTEWGPRDCGLCPAVDEAGHDIELAIVSFNGQFLVRGAVTPKSEYDDANLWLENPRTHDRVSLGNTHDQEFAVRVTPGIYDVIYEVESPGAQLPHNPRVRLQKLALFASRTQDIDIPVASLSGAILLNGAPPPKSEYDDANLSFRDHETGSEILAGNTHDGSYAVSLVPGTYDVIYRVETAGPITPRNDGAVLETLSLPDIGQTHAIEITSAPLHGDFLINDAPAPASEYDDANIDLVSPEAGTVWLGNTHDGSYTLQVIPGEYALVYRHESGPNVPQNQRARFGDVVEVSADGGPADVNIEMVELTGAMTINGEVPPASDYDDGLLHLRGDEFGDSVLLGNTHDGSFVVKLIPGTYAVYYGQETSGGTVPQNKQARLLDQVVVADTSELAIDIKAVAIGGAFTLAGEPPPASKYEDGRIYLRDTITGDAVLLGSTHVGSYTAIVVPGNYEVFYVQETAGGLLPANQNAPLVDVMIAAAMNLDLDVPVVDLSGQIQLIGGPAPVSPSDGGQLYLRAPGGDSVLLGDSFLSSYAVRLLAGTYGVYYRSEASVTMPQNENGRFACVTIE